MKKALSIFLAAMLIAVLAAGCGTTPSAPSPSEPPEGSTSQSPSAPTDTSPESEDAGELKLAIMEGGFGPAFWNEITAMFEAETGIKVSMDISPDIGDTVRPQIVAGNVPDFLNIADSDKSGVVATMIKDRALLSLDDVFNGPQFDSDAPLKDKIVPGFLDSFKCTPYKDQGDSKIYLAPGSAGPMGLIYNINLFEKNNWDLPVTWDDFFALGEKAKAAGTSLFTYQGQHPGYWESMLLPALASALGADYAKIENFTPGIWTDPRALAVLEQIAKISTTGNLMPGTVGLDHVQSQAAQMMDKALFIPCGTWMEGEMADAERAEGYQFGMAPPPVLESGDTRYVAAYCEQFSIPAGAPNANNAKLFLRYLYTDKAIELYAKLCDGAIMATTNALDIVKPYVSEGVYGMHSVFNEPGAAALIFGFAAPPEGTTIIYKDEIYNPIGDVMSGKMTALQWAESMNQAYQDMADGL